ncbi:MAG: hypothetical protein A2W34_00075 [Chloroflexi bacterium RBG_16_64_32]|nr:MAG: hypothetical protein A2W34_00075 [Chloroflexi bacterium RBG_16_64_32]
MTLALAIETLEGVVLAADSRVAVRERGKEVAMDTASKIYQLSDHVVVTESGAGDLAKFIISATQRRVRQEGWDGVTNVFVQTRPFIIQLYDDAVSRLTADQRPHVGFIFGGMDQDDSAWKPRILSMYSREGFRPLEATTGMDCTGAVWIAEYLFGRFYSRRTSLEEACKLASLLVRETASQCADVGGPVQMAIVTSEGFQQVEPPEVRLAYR